MAAAAPIRLRRTTAGAAASRACTARPPSRPSRPSRSLARGAGRRVAGPPARGAATIAGRSGRPSSRHGARGRRAPPARGGGSRRRPRAGPPGPRSWGRPAAGAYPLAAAPPPTRSRTARRTTVGAGGGAGGRGARGRGRRPRAPGALGVPRRCSGASRGRREPLLAAGDGGAGQGRRPEPWAVSSSAPAPSRSAPAG